MVYVRALSSSGAVVLLWLGASCGGDGTARTEGTDGGAGAASGGRPTGSAGVTGASGSAGADGRLITKFRGFDYYVPPAPTSTATTWPTF